MPHKLLGDNVGSNERFLHYQIFLPFRLHFKNMQANVPQSFEVYQITRSNKNQIKII